MELGKCSAVKHILNGPNAFNALNAEPIDSIYEKVRQHVKTRIIVLKSACD